MKTYDVQENASSLYGQNNNGSCLGSGSEQNVQYQFFKKYANPDDGVADQEV